jgi:hypothetical protein
MDERHRGIRYGAGDRYRGLLGQASSERDEEPPRKRSALGFWLVTFRYVIPAVLVLTGTVLMLTDWPDGAEAFSLFAGAGLSILLLNVLFRMGVQGDAERRREDEAREYFTQHGHWPDEGERGT